MEAKCTKHKKVTVVVQQYLTAVQKPPLLTEYNDQQIQLRLAAQVDSVLQQRTTADCQVQRGTSLKQWTALGQPPELSLVKTHG